MDDSSLLTSFGTAPRVEDERLKTLMLWGETQAGKTTLLTTAIMSTQSIRHLTMIDRARSTDEMIRAGLTTRHRRLSEGRTIDSTSEKMEFSLTLSDDTRLQIRDIKGADTREPHLMREWLPTANAILCVIECCGPNLGIQMAAIDALLPLVANTNVKIGLAITKCEQVLSRFDPVWKSWPAGWEKSALYPIWEPWKSQLSAFGDAVWATSAFGYDEDRPACVLSEYGVMLPYRIQPLNVYKPLLWYFGKPIP
jgi:hypothetical protein